MSTDVSTATVRAWAQSQGLHVAERGRLKPDVLKAYAAANGSTGKKPAPVKKAASTKTAAKPTVAKAPERKTAAKTTPKPAAKPMPKPKSAPRGGEPGA